MKENAVIVGAGTYGQVYSTYLKKKFNIIGFIDDNAELLDTKVYSIPIIGNVEWAKNNLDRGTHIFVPIGNNEVRVNLLKEFSSLGFSIPSFIHESVVFGKNIQIGNGVYVLPSCNFMPFVTIGDYVMVSMGVNVAHHTILSEGTFLSQGCNIGASILIEEQAYCGIGVTVMTGVKEVGRKALIGAGSVVIRNIPSFSVVVGNPGKVIRYIND